MEPTHASRRLRLTHDMKQQERSALREHAEALDRKVLCRTTAGPRCPPGLSPHSSAHLAKVRLLPGVLRREMRPSCATLVATIANQSWGLQRGAPAPNLAKCPRGTLRKQTQKDRPPLSCPAMRGTPRGGTKELPWLRWYSAAPQITGGRFRSTGTETWWQPRLPSSQDRQWKPRRTERPDKSCDKNPLMISMPSPPAGAWPRWGEADAVQPSCSKHQGRQLAHPQQK
mmetsp:Transcript_34902/g.84299  ORF Transcript_34902/g.84299 Transcript_34902/m.84299 type:complete len:228 (-) Transcript_34902:1010-1693(-)